MPSDWVWGRRTSRVLIKDYKTQAWWYVFVYLLSFILSPRYDYPTLEVTCTVCLKLHAIAAFEQRGAADFPTPGNSSFTGIVNAARQFHVRCASADATPYPTLNSTVQPSDNELNTRQIRKNWQKKNSSALKSHKFFVPLRVSAG